MSEAKIENHDHQHEHDHKQRGFQISTETLIPVSLVITLSTVIYFVAQLSSLANANRRDLEQNNQRIYDRVEQMDNDLAILKNEIGRANGKLDILVRLSVKNADNE